MDLLVIGGMFALMILCAAVGPALLSRRRRAALDRGADAVFRVRLAGGHAPYPRTPRRGVLRLGPDSVTWSARGGGPRLDLSQAGLRPVGLRDPQRGDRAMMNDSVVLTAADAFGTPLRLVGITATVEQLERVLRDRPPPASPAPPLLVSPGSTRGVLVPPALLLLVGLLGAAFTGWAVVAGVPVTGVVVAEPDGDGEYCPVRWTDPRDGVVRTNEVACYWDVGDEASLIALADPLRGEVVDAEDPWFWGVVSAVVVAGAVGFGWWRRRDHQRDLVARPVVGPVVDQPAPLSADRLSYDDVAGLLRARAAAEGWPFDVDPDAAAPQPWPARSGRRLLALQLGMAGVPLLLAAPFALLLGWTSVAGLWASSGPTREVVATVTDEPYEGFPFGPADLQVTFPLEGGGSETTLVAVRGLPDPPPATLRIEHSVENPDRARALEHDGARRGTGMAAGLLALGAAVSGWRLWRTGRDRRAEERARAGARRYLRYALTPFGGACVLVLFEPGAVGPPRYALDLAEDPRGRIPAAGTVEVRGPWQPGEVVVPLVDGQELRTASPLLEVDVDDLLALLNATEVVGA